MCKLTAIFVLLFSVSSAFAQQRRCTDVEGQRAEMQTDTLRSWNALYKWYRLYRQCDDGGVAEGYSEAVARTLVDHWSTLPRLVDLATKHARFRHFVLKHVDATLDINDIKKIRAKAKTQCPSGLGKICVDLTKQAGAALKQDASLGIN